MFPEIWKFLALIDDLIPSFGFLFYYPLEFPAFSHY